MRLHARGLKMPMQMKVYALRTSKKPPPSWKHIAFQVQNLHKKRPYWKVCRAICAKLRAPPHKVQDAYKNCGRRPILNKVTRKWIVSRLVSLRRTQEVTSTDLQAELAKDKGIHVEASSFRQALKAEGYRYLSRSQKPRYSKNHRPRNPKICLGKASCKQAQALRNFPCAGMRDRKATHADGAQGVGWGPRWTPCTSLHFTSPTVL